MVELQSGNNVFYARSVTHDGFSPDLLRTRRWCIRRTSPRKHKLAEALGLDSDLRAPSADTSIQISCKSSVAIKLMYYAVAAGGGLGKSKGEGFTCLKEEQVMCLHCKTRQPGNIIEALRTKPVDPQDTYQQFKIVRNRTQNGANVYFFAESVGDDGFPPDYLRKKCWDIRTKRPRKYKLAEALGLNSSLRARITDIKIQISETSSEAVKVGMWYCPFMFIKDRTLVYQMKNSMYYEMTLEQRWEQIFECKIEHINSNVVRINAPVQKEVVLVAGMVAVWDEKKLVDKAIWFKGIETKGKEVSIGLSVEIVERMKWEEERVGYVGESG